MNKYTHIRELISHDGLKDSLTGLMCLPAFLDSAVREIGAATRDQRNINLFLISLAETSSAGEVTLSSGPSKAIADRDEQQIFDLAARVLRAAHAYASELRAHDLLARYTFTEFLLINSGDTVEIERKLATISDKHGAAFVGSEIVKVSAHPLTNHSDSEANLPNRNQGSRQGASQGSRQGSRHGSEPISTLQAAIASLEQELHSRYPMSNAE